MRIKGSSFINQDAGGEQGRVESGDLKEKALKLLNPRGSFISAFLAIVGPQGRGTSAFHVNT